MLFGGKREPRLRRVLIVEDEPLVAFDNEHVLGDAGYEVVATVDSVAGAVARISAGGIDLVLSDVKLSDGDGVAVAEAAKQGGIPILFATGNCPEQARTLAVGCLAKPYSAGELLSALAAVEAKVSGETVRKKPRALTLFG